MLEGASSNSHKSSQLLKNLGSLSSVAALVAAFNSRDASGVTVSNGQQQAFLAVGRHENSVVSDLVCKESSAPLHTTTASLRNTCHGSELLCTLSFGQ